MFGIIPVPEMLAIVLFELNTLFSVVLKLSFID
jgi:hypothetical protein